jgi:hypothetical protein
MIAPALQRLLQILTPASAAEIDQTFRALRAQNLIPTTPRGRGVPPAEMMPEHAAWTLLTLAINRPPAAAAEVVRDWAAMRPIDTSLGADNFGDALGAALSDPGARMKVFEIRIGREWPNGWLVLGDRNDPRLYAFGLIAAEARAAGYRTTACRSEFIISGGALHQIAIDLASPEGGLFGSAAEIVSEDVS